MRSAAGDVTKTMKTLYDCIVKAVEKGYYESFKLLNDGLATPDGKHIYNAGDVTISSLYTCEAYSNSIDNSVLYLIKTSDGRKGTLIDVRGSSDSRLSQFIQQVNSLRKQPPLKRQYWFNFLKKNSLIS